jgi:hypothetical protein
MNTKFVMKTISERLNLFLLTFAIFIFSTGFLIAQEENNGSDNFKLRGFGLSVGIYDPELDYWKSDTNSQFRDAEFSTNLFASGFLEVSLVKNLAAKIGIGYWQTRAETIIPSYGKTTMLLTGNPVSLDIIYYAKPIKFFFVTPYVGVGGEYLFIQYNLDFEDKENPDPVNGSSAVFSGLLGLELAISKNFAIDLFGEYKQGEYEQSFIRQIESADPDLPDAEAEFTEKISLNGPKLGISLKYKF